MGHSVFFHGSDNNGSWDWTKSQTEAWRVFKAKCKHVTNRLWAQWESRGELVIAFIISSRIKMSTSMKKAVLLCSLIIRGSILPFQIKQTLCNQNDRPGQRTPPDLHLIFSILHWRKALLVCEVKISVVISVVFVQIFWSVGDTVTFS